MGMSLSSGMIVFPYFHIGPKKRSGPATTVISAVFLERLTVSIKIPVKIKVEGKIVRK